MHSRIDIATPMVFASGKEIRDGLEFDCVVFESIRCNSALILEVQLAICEWLGTCPLTFSSRSFRSNCTKDSQFSFLQESPPDFPSMLLLVGSAGLPPLALRILKLSVWPTLQPQTVESIATTRTRGVFLRPARSSSIQEGVNWNFYHQLAAPC